MASAWSKDLKITATINKALVAQCIAAETPVGDHSHDDRHWGYDKRSAGGSIVRRKYKGEDRGGWPRKGGRLRNFFGHIPNWHLKDKGTACYITVFLPYVRILNFGGSVSGIDFQNAEQNQHVKSAFRERGFTNQRRTIYRYWLMHWADGDSVFRSKRRGFTLPATHFIERGVRTFANHGGNAIKVEWAKGTDTA